MKCPRCSHPLEVTAWGEEWCTHCAYVNRIDFYDDDRQDEMLERAWDRDEGWGEAASSFVRDLDEQHIRELSS